MSEVIAALRAGVSAILEGVGRGDLAETVRGGDVELVGPSETWWMGAREVAAQRVVLSVDAEDFAALTRSPGDREAIKEAFAQAVRSPSTELADLHLELRLPGIARPWRHVYREAPARARPELDPAEVLEGAAELLDAQGVAEGAAMVRRAALETAELPGAPVPLVRVVLRLVPADRAAMAPESRLERQVQEAVHAAAARAEHELSVTVGVLPAARR